MILNDVVTVMRPTTITDQYNNRKQSWANPSTTVVSAQVQPVGSNERIGARERNQVLADFRVWLPRGTQVTAQDRIQWHDTLLHVSSAPARWKSVSGAIDHVTVDCIVSEG